MAPHFETGQVQEILNGIEDNGQIWFAGDMPEILAKFYDAVGHDRAANDAWRRLMDFLDGRADDPDDHFAYPRLREKLVRDGIWRLVRPSD